MRGIKASACARNINSTSTSLRHAFSGNSKQLERHDNVYVSSVSTDYSFSSSYVVY